MNAYILTTDRYWPWNGADNLRSDRIWNNLDQLLNIPFLVYKEKNNQVTPEKHANFDIAEKKNSFQTLYFFLLILIKAYSLSFIFRNKRFLLGNPIFIRRNALVWYWSYATLREFFSNNKVDLLIYHGELDDWGRSVSWACKDASVKAVAWQHGVITKGFLQYTLIENDKWLPLPVHLFLWSNQAAEVSVPMIANMIPATVVGTDRITIGYERFKPRDSFKALICPSTQDHESYMHFFEENSTFFFDDPRIILKPHPLRQVPKKIKDVVNTTNADLVDILRTVSVVILSSGTLAVEALRMQIPVIVIKQFCMNDLIPYQIEMPGIYICDDFEQSKRLIDDFESNGRALDRSQFHNTARYYADDLNIELVHRTLKDIFNSKK